MDSTDDLKRDQEYDANIRINFNPQIEIKQNAFPPRKTFDKT